MHSPQKTRKKKRRRESEHATDPSVVVKRHKPIVVHADVHASAQKAPLIAQCFHLHTTTPDLIIARSVARSPTVLDVHVPVTPSAHTVVDLVLASDHDAAYLNLLLAPHDDTSNKAPPPQTLAKAHVEAANEDVGVLLDTTKGATREMCQWIRSVASVPTRALEQCVMVAIGASGTGKSHCIRWACRCYEVSRREFNCICTQVKKEEDDLIAEFKTVLTHDYGRTHLIHVFDAEVASPRVSNGMWTAIQDTFARGHMRNPVVFECTPAAVYKFEPLRKRSRNVWKIMQQSTLCTWSRWNPVWSGTSLKFLKWFCAHRRPPKGTTWDLDESESAGLVASARGNLKRLEMAVMWLVLLPKARRRRLRQGDVLKVSSRHCVLNVTRSCTAGCRWITSPLDVYSHLTYASPSRQSTCLFAPDTWRCMAAELLYGVKGISPWAACAAFGRYALGQGVIAAPTPLQMNEHYMNPEATCALALDEYADHVSRLGVKPRALQRATRHALHWFRSHIERVRYADLTMRALLSYRGSAASSVNRSHLRERCRVPQPTSNQMKCVADHYNSLVSSSSSSTSLSEDDVLASEPNPSNASDDLELKALLQYDEWCSDLDVLSAGDEDAFHVENGDDDDDAGGWRRELGQYALIAARVFRLPIQNTRDRPSAKSILQAAHAVSWSAKQSARWHGYTP